MTMKRTESNKDIDPYFKEQNDVNNEEDKGPKYQKKLSFRHRMRSYGYIVSALFYIIFFSLLINYISMSLLKSVLFVPSSSRAHYSSQTVLPHNSHLVTTQNSPLPQYLRAPKNSNDSQKKNIIDFFIVGFPKCGTTALLYAFKKNNETLMPSKEYCDISSSKMTPSESEQSLLKLKSTMEELMPNPHKSSSHESRHVDSAVKRGIKCPMAIRNIKSIETMMNHNSDVRIIIGVRHPVLFFESFYNYRVTEMYNKGKMEKVPPPEKLIGGKNWKNVSTELARFEYSLMQLGKTSLSQIELNQLTQKGLSVMKTNQPNNHSMKIFLYSIEQLDDPNEDTSKQFRASMQQFLGLQHPMEPFSHENTNRVKQHPENIDICHKKYTKLRRILITHARETQRWILNKFVRSEGVFVGGREQFNEALARWSIDPCSASK